MVGVIEHPEWPAWDKLTPRQRIVYARRVTRALNDAGHEIERLRTANVGAVEDRDHYKAALEGIAGWATGTGEAARRALATAPSTTQRGQ